MKTLLKKGMAFSGALFLLSMFKLDVAIPGSNELLSIGACTTSAQAGSLDFVDCYESGILDEGMGMYTCDPCEWLPDYRKNGPQSICVPHV